MDYRIHCYDKYLFIEYFFIGKKKHCKKDFVLNIMVLYETQHETMRFRSVQSI